ncbi:MAG: hypothetical protein J2P17_28020 [Mycobacterium sp.]|nr:hypothetical protein [Mycobacterium sp.]
MLISSGTQADDGSVAVLAAPSAREGILRPSSAHFQMFAGSGKSPVRWRLLSGNNRELGRSAYACDDAEACRTELEKLLADLDLLESRLRLLAPHRWCWELLRDGFVVAVAGHLFERQVRCHQVLDQFLRDAPLASTSEAVVIGTYRRRKSKSVGVG